MKGNGFVDVAVGYTVPIGHQESILVNESQHTFEPAAGHGSLAGVDQGYAPILFIMLVMVFDLRPRPQAQGDVAGVPMVIAEVILDDFALVPQAQNEILMAIVRIDLHYVPKN